MPSPWPDRPGPDRVERVPFGMAAVALIARRRARGRAGGATTQTECRARSRPGQESQDTGLGSYSHHSCSPKPGPDMAKYSLICPVLLRQRETLTALRISAKTRFIADASSRTSASIAARSDNKSMLSFLSAASVPVSSATFGLDWGDSTGGERGLLPCIRDYIWSRDIR